MAETYGERYTGEEEFDSENTAEALGASALDTGDQAPDGAGEINLDRLQAAFPAMTVEQAMEYISWAPTDKDLRRIEGAPLPTRMHGGIKVQYIDTTHREYEDRIQYELGRVTDGRRSIHVGPVISYVEPGMSAREAIRLADTRLVKWWLEASDGEVKRNDSDARRAWSVINEQLKADSYLAEADRLLPPAGADLEAVPDIDIKKFRAWRESKRSAHGNVTEVAGDGQAQTAAEVAIDRDQALGSCGYERVLNWVSAVECSISPESPDEIIQQLTDREFVLENIDTSSALGPSQTALTAASLLARDLRAGDADPENSVDESLSVRKFMRRARYLSDGQRRVGYAETIDGLFDGDSFRARDLGRDFQPIDLLVREFIAFRDDGHITTGVGNVVFPLNLNVFKQYWDKTPVTVQRDHESAFQNIWLAEYHKHLMQIFTDNPDSLLPEEQSLAAEVTKAQNDRIAQLEAFEQMALDERSDAVVYAFAELSVKVMGMSPAFRFNEEYKQRIKTVLAERGLDIDDLAERSEAIKEAKTAEASRLETDPHAGSTRSAARSRIPPTTQVSTGFGRLKTVTSWFRRGSGAEAPEGQQPPEIQPPQELNGLEQQLLTIWQEYTNCTTDSSYHAGLIMESIAPGDATATGPDAI